MSEIIKDDARPDYCVGGRKFHKYGLGDQSGVCIRCHRTGREIYQLKGERKRKLREKNP